MSSRRAKQLMVLGMALWLLLSYSCSRQSTFAYEFKMPPSGWPADSIVRFTIEADSLLPPQNILFTLRHDANYPNANLYLFVTVRTPDGSTQRDTLNFPLCDGAGNWYGDGFANEWTIELPYALGVRYEQSGAYQFAVQQGMRYRILPGVESFGCLVLAAKPSN